jgi:spermidine/putrescine transport system permease protein
MSAQVTQGVGAPPNVERRVPRRLVTPLDGRITEILQLGPATTFLLLFFVVPLFVFFLYSFWKTENYDIVQDWTFDNYSKVASDPVYAKLFRNTAEIALWATAVSVVMAYGFAYVIRFHLRRYQEALLFAVMIAMFSGYLVRIYAWRTILGETGILNTFLETVGVIERPLSFLLYSKTSAIIVLSNFLLPLAILPIYASLQNVRDDEIEAARDLGCGAMKAAWKVTFPLAWKGVFASAALCFIVAAGDYVTPQLVGGTSGSMVGRAISTSFTAAYDWPGGSALAFVTLALILSVVGVIRVVGTRVVR